VVCEDVELPPLQQEAEVADGGIGGKKFSIESGVSNLGRIQLFGEESQRFPGLPTTLL
jgi:hypothetical protein